jgi:hypothetical protein
METGSGPRGFRRDHYFGPVLYSARPATDDLLASEIVSGHVRSMMADHLTDVPSSRPAYGKTMV